ncbi:MAG: hypothetical protein EBR41_03540, partial [Crocinitomicaceae bacterium]|nr:hypothetical protein [Crocinitomicaceae bacterium]
ISSVQKESYRHSEGAAGQEFYIATAAKSAKFAKSIGLGFDEIKKEGLSPLPHHHPFYLFKAS